MADEAIDNLIALFGPGIRDTLNIISAQGLTPEVEQMIFNTLDRLSFNATTFGNKITSEYARLLAGGMDPSKAQAVLNKSMTTGGSMFGTLRHDTKEGIVEGMNQSGRMGQLDEYGPLDQTFAWVTVSGHKICSDCQARAGQVLTWAEWEAEGLPGAGWSLCGGFCYCVLDPTGKLSKEVQAPPGVQEPKAKSKAPEVTSRAARYVSVKKGLEETQRFWKSKAVKESESRAAARYFAEDYSDMNKIARFRAAGKSDDWIRAELRLDQATFASRAQQIDDLQAYLAKAPRVDRLSYRGIYIEMGETRLDFLDRFQPGKMLTNNSFWSSSYNKPPFRQNIELTIKGKNGVLADGLEAYAEQEILFNIGSKFKVISKDTSGRVVKILLEEVE